MDQDENTMHRNQQSRGASGDEHRRLSGSEPFIKCLYCRKIIGRSDDSFSCPECHTIYHTACWERIGRCINTSCPSNSSITEARSESSRSRSAFERNPDSVSSQLESLTPPRDRSGEPISAEDQIRILDHEEDNAFEGEIPRRKPPLRKGRLPWSKNYKVWFEPEKEPIQIILSQNAYDDLVEHASIHSHREVGGVLLGKVYRFEHKYYVQIEHILPARKTDSNAVSLQFTHDTWSDFTRQQNLKFPQQNYPDLIIVGWYHTHPDLTPFFSGSDESLHGQNFSQPWHIALVLDPVNQLMEFFVWRGQTIKPARGFYELFTLQNKSLTYWDRPRNRSQSTVDRTHTPGQAARDGEHLRQTGPYYWGYVIIILILVILSGNYYFVKRLEKISDRLVKVQTELDTLAQLQSAPTQQPPGQSIDPTLPAFDPALTLVLPIRITQAGTETNQVLIGQEMEVSVLIRNDGEYIVTPTLWMLIRNSTIESEMFVPLAPAITFEPSQLQEMHGIFVIPQSGEYEISIVEGATPQLGIFNTIPDSNGLLGSLTVTAIEAPT